MMLDCLPQARSSVSCRHVCVWGHYSVFSLCGTAEWTPNERKLVRRQYTGCILGRRGGEESHVIKIMNISCNFIENLGLFIIDDM
jgi:hypothetical protein